MTNNSRVERVVVITTMSIYPNATATSAAAQLEEMGLAAYRPTADEAIAALKRLFVAEITKRREDGTLERYLNRLGVKWFPEEEYKATGKPYEDAATGTVISMAPNPNPLPSRRVEVKERVAALAGSRPLAA